MYTLDSVIYLSNNWGQIVSGPVVSNTKRDLAVQNAGNVSQVPSAGKHVTDANCTKLTSPHRDDAY